MRRCGGPERCGDFLIAPGGEPGTNGNQGDAQRTFTYLNLYGYCTDLVVCNRVLPSTVEDAFFDAWKVSQARHLEFIKECFDPIPIFHAPLMNREVVGIEALHELAGTIFDTRDPANRFYSGQAQELTSEDGTYTMKIPIPFTALDEISVIPTGRSWWSRWGTTGATLRYPTPWLACR